VQIALVSRELYPYVGGRIAPIVTAAARELSRIAEVTVVTSAEHRGAYERLRARGDARVLPDAVRHAWVADPPEDHGAWLSYLHAYSARVDAALRAAYPAGGPDVIEFCDYLAEGFVTVQARHTEDPWLADTLVCVRLQTTSEICAVLDGHLPSDVLTMAIHDAERYTLRHADRLLWPGGDVLETYRRYYGADALAPAVRIPDAFLAEPGLDLTSPAEGGEPEAADAPLRLLFLGRAERRKGVQELVRAMTMLETADVRLTLLGADTRSGPLQTSLRTSLELMAAQDPRIALLDPVERGAVGAHLRAADVVVVPSLWECWPNVAREALMHNRPVLGTPVGGLCEMVRPGESGWLTRDGSAKALADAIEDLVGRRAEVRELIDSRRPRAVFEELTDAEALVDRYRALAAERSERPSRPARRRPPLVSVVVPYFKLDRHLGETLESVWAQTHCRVEVIVANDGSLREDDAFLFDLARDERVTVVTQPNAGLSAARNFGISQARGDYVLPLDADDLIEPTFLERCVEALERRPELAYVTTYVEYMLPDSTRVKDDCGGYVPYGNWSRLMERNNVGGTCSSVFRRRVFELGFRYSRDLTSYEDWLLYLELARAGHHGAVVPERLFRYRVRPESMMRMEGSPRTEIIVDEITAHMRESEVRWLAGAR